MVAYNKTSFHFGMACVLISSIFLCSSFWVNDQRAGTVGFWCLTLGLISLLIWALRWTGLGEVVVNLTPRQQIPVYNVNNHQPARSIPWNTMTAAVAANWYPIALAFFCGYAIFFLVEGTLTFNIREIALGVTVCLFIWLLWVYKNDKWGNVTKWMKATGFPFVSNHRKGVWLTVSLIGFAICLFTPTYPNTLAAWRLSTILAGITFFSLWEGIILVVGKALGLEYGKGIGAACWSMALFGVASMLHIMTGTSDAYMFIFGLSLICAWVSIGLMIHKIISKKSP